MAQNKPYFMTIEGIEGVGKSTNIEFIKRYLDAKHIEYIHTREPGGTALAEKIRELLLQEHSEKVNEVSELLLMFASRAQHIQEVIKPALALNKWVICDRFTDATFAYQGGGRGVDISKIETLQQLVQDDLRPDLTFILDLEPSIGLSRAAKRSALDRFEKEELDFFNKVRANYLQRAAQDPQRCKVIDASQNLEKVAADIEGVLSKQLLSMGS